MTQEQKAGLSLEEALDISLGQIPVRIDSENEELMEERKEVPPSPTALQLDRWSQRRGRDWAESDDGQAIFATVPENDRRYVAADFLSAAWEPAPALAERCEDARRHHFLSTLLQSPQYESLHRSTMLNDVAAELAAAAFTKQWFELVATEQPEDELDQDAQAIEAANDACDEAKTDVTDFENACRSLGGDGSMDDYGMSADQVRQLFEKVRSNRMLRRIMELAGRYRNLAQSMQHGKPCHGADEVVGIETGDELSQLVPSEYAFLDDDVLEMDFLRRFSEATLTIEELRATENESKGPLVIVVDESGSMHGDPIANAKAMALAILWIAEHQNRWACLVGFAGGTDGNYLVVPPGQRDIAALTEWLAHFYSGGTDRDVPLVELPAKWNELGCPEGKTDIIIITDGILRIPADMETRFMTWKENTQVKLNTIILAYGTQKGDMDRVSDRLWLSTELNLETAGVSECLSI